jgi:hypothetical protein
MFAGGRDRMTGAERRRHPRVVADVPVRLLVAGGEHAAHLRDICREAALVEASSKWPLETEVAIKMQLPGVSDLIEVRGRVIREVAGEGSHPYGMAILFHDVTPIAALRIDFFVALQTDLKEAGGGPPAR